MHMSSNLLPSACRHSITLHVRNGAWAALGKKDGGTMHSR